MRKTTKRGDVNTHETNVGWGRIRADLTNTSMSYKSAWANDQLVWDLMNIALDP